MGQNKVQDQSEYFARLERENEEFETGESDKDRRLRQKSMAFEMFQRFTIPHLDSLVDDDADKGLATYTSAGAMLQYWGTEAVDDYMSKDQMKAIFGHNEQAGVGDVFANGTPSQRQELMKKYSGVRFKAMKVFGGILAAEHAASASASLIESLSRTEIAATEEGRQKILVASYAAGRGILLGKDASDDFLKRANIGNSPEDRLLRDTVDSAVTLDNSDDGLAETIGSVGALELLSRDPLNNYKAFLINDGGSPKLAVREVEIINGKARTFADIENTDVTGANKSKFSRTVSYLGSEITDNMWLPMVTKWVLGKTGVRTTEESTAWMRKAMLEEQASSGELGGAVTIAGTIAGIGANIADAAIMSMVTAALASSGLGIPAAAGTGAGAVYKFGKAGRLIARLGRQLLMAAKVAHTGMLDKSYSSGAGFTKGYDFTGENADRLYASGAFDAATYYASMGLSEHIMSKGTNVIIGQAAKHYAAGNTSKFMSKLALHGIVHNAGDVLVDTAMDVSAHNVIEAVTGKDPFTVDQELTLSLQGEENMGADFVPALARQVMTRLGSRVSGKIINSTFSAKIPKDQMSALMGTEEWVRSMKTEMGDTSLNKYGMARNIISLNRKMFNSSLQNVNEMVRNASPQGGDGSLFKAIADTNNPTKTYAYLWKVQERITNDAFRNMSRSTVTIGEGSTKTRIDAVSNFNTLMGINNGTLGSASYAEGLTILNNNTNFTVRSIEDADKLSSFLSNYVLNGGGSDTGSNAQDIYARHQQAAAFLANHVHLQYKDSNKFSGDYLAKIGKKIGDSIVDQRLTPDEAKPLAEIQNKIFTGVDSVPNTIETSNLKAIAFSDQEVGKNVTFAFDDASRDRAKSAYQRALDEANEQTKNRNIILKQERDDLTRALSSPGASEQEKARLSSAIKKLDNYEAYLNNDVEPGITRVVDFYEGVVGKTDYVNALNGTGKITGSMVADLTGAAQNLIRIYVGAMNNELGSGERGSVKRVLEGMNDTQINSLLSQYAVPLASVMRAFYGNISDTHKQLAKQAIEPMFDALRGKNLESVTTLGRTLQVMTAMDEINADRVSVLNILSSQESMAQNVSTAHILGHDLNPLRRLAILSESLYPEQSGVEVRSEDGYRLNDVDVKGLHSLLYTLDNKDIDDTGVKLDTARKLMGIIAGKVASSEALDHMMVTAPNSINTDAIVKAANASLVRIFEVNNEASLPVKVESVDVGAQDGTPKISIKFGEIKKDLGGLNGYFDNIMNGLKETSKASSRTRSIFLSETLAATQSIFTGSDGTSKNISEIANDISKINPGVLDALKVSAMSFVKDGNFSNVNAAIEAERILMSQASRALYKYDSSQRKQIALALTRKALVEADTNLGVEFVNGSLAYMLSRTTKRVISSKNGLVFIEGGGEDAYEHSVLERAGFIFVASQGASSTPLYVKLPKKYEDLDIDFILKDLSEAFQEQVDEYKVGSYDASNTFAAEALKEFQRLRTVNNNGDFAQDPKKAADSIIDALGKAWNAVNKNILEDELKSDKIDMVEVSFTDGTTKMFSIRETMSNYKKRRDASLRLPLAGAIDAINAAKLKLGNLDETMKVDKLKEKIDSIDLSQFKSNSSLKGLDGIIETIRSMPVDKVEEIKAAYKSFLNSMSEKEKAINKEIAELSENTFAQDSITRFALNKMTDTKELEFVKEMLMATATSDSGAKAQDVGHWLINDIDGASLRVLRDAMKKSAMRDVNKETVEQFKSSNPTKTLANAVAIIATKGWALQMKTNEFAKRVATTMIGGGASPQDAALIRNNMLALINKNRVNNGLAEIRDLKIKLVLSEGGDGHNAAPPEFIKALADSRGSSPDLYGKFVLDAGGGVGKIQYQQKSSLLADDGTITVEISPSNLKLMTKADMDFFMIGVERGFSLDVDILRFIKAHKLHSESFSRVRPGHASVQLDATEIMGLAIRLNQNFENKNLGDNVAGYTGDLKDAIFSAYRSIRGSQDRDSFVATATWLDDTTPPAVYTISPTTFSSIKLSYKKANDNTLNSQAHVEVGVTMLANLAEKVFKNYLTDDIRNVIREVRTNEAEGTDMNDTDIHRVSFALLEFLSKKRDIGNHIIKTTVNGEVAYFLGTSRSPQPESSASFKLITGVANVRDGSQVRLSSYAQALSSGDFDGDLTLGLPLVKVEDLARSIGTVLDGDGSQSRTKAILEKLGDHILRAESNFVARRSIYSFFAGAPIPDEKTVSKFPLGNNNLQDGNQAIFGAIKMITDLNMIRYSIMFDKLPMFDTEFGNEIQALLDRYRLTGTSIIDPALMFRPEVRVGTGMNSPMSNRLVLMKVYPGGGDIIAPELLGGKALGSIRILHTVNVSDDNDQPRAVAVYESTSTAPVGDGTAKTSKAFGTMVVEQPNESFKFKVLAIDSEEQVTKSLGEAISKANDIAKKDSSTILDGLNVLGKDNQLYAASPDALFSQLDNSSTTPKGVQEVIMKHYPGKPEEFMKDYKSYAAEVMAASLVPVHIETSVDGNVYTKPSFLNLSGNPIFGKLDDNTSFSEESTSTAIRNIKRTIEGHLSALENATSAMGSPENNISLARQQHIFTELFKGGDYTPGQILNYAQIKKGVGYTGGNLGMLDFDSLSLIKSTLMDLDNPYMNKKKLDFTTDVNNIVGVIKDLSSGMYDMTHGSLVKLKDVLKKESLYFDNPGKNVDLVDIVIERLTNQRGVFHSRKEIQNVLNNIGIKLGERRTVREKAATDILSATFNNGREKDKYTERQMTPLLFTNGREATAFELNTRLTGLIEKLEKPNSGELLNVTRDVLTAVIDQLSDDSRARAVWAAEGLGEHTMSKIISMVESGDIRSNAIGGLKINLNALINYDSELKSNIKDSSGNYLDANVEDKFSVKTELQAVSRIRKLRLIDSVRKGVYGSYYDGGC